MSHADIEPAGYHCWRAIPGDEIVSRGDVTVAVLRNGVQILAISVPSGLIELIEVNRPIGQRPQQAEPVATVVDNNQPGWRNIIATDPNVTLDVGQKLYAATPADDEAVKLLERARQAICEQGIGKERRPLIVEIDAYLAKLPQ